MGIKSQTTLALLSALLLSACSTQHGPSQGAIKAYGAQKATEGPRQASQAPVKVPADPKAKSAMASQVKLTVLRGTNIPDNDPGPGHTDAYVIIDYEGDRHKTAVRETASPEWGDSFVLDTRPGGVLKLTLMDSDLVSDDTLGVASQRLPTVRSGQTREFKMTFQGAKGGEVHLMVEGM